MEPLQEELWLCWIGCLEIEQRLAMIATLSTYYFMINFR